MTLLKNAVKCVGIGVVASACGISPRAVYKWLKKGSLPKTEFYGRTHYSMTIEELSEGQFGADKLLEESRLALLSR